MVQTKAELAHELNEARLHHQEFRALVAKVGLAEGERHDWCEVVREILADLGLAEFIPGTYGVEQKMEPRGGWIYFYQGYRDTVDNEAKARALAEKLRADAIRDERRDYTHRWRGHKKWGRRQRFVAQAQSALESFDSRALQVTIDVDDSPEEIERKRTEAQERWDEIRSRFVDDLAQARKEPPEDKPPFEEPKYPIFRAIYTPYRGKKQVLA